MQTTSIKVDYEDNNKVMINGYVPVDVEDWLEIGRTFPIIALAKALEPEVIPEVVHVLTYMPLAKPFNPEPCPELAVEPRLDGQE